MPRPAGRSPPWPGGGSETGARTTPSAAMDHRGRFGTMRYGKMALPGMNSTKAIGRQPGQGSHKGIG